jgi:hypothetical protein
MLVKTTIHSIEEFKPYDKASDGSGYTRAVVDGERYPIFLTLTIEQYDSIKTPCFATLEVWPKLYTDKMGTAKPALGTRLLSFV